jgi:RHS repeat-associated protein
LYLQDGCQQEALHINNFFSYMKRWSPSPYINHFVSADTVVPGYTNPQNLNRYSYVGNNPLRYTDPSGHMLVEDEGSTKGGLDCRKFPQYCNNGKKKSDQELLDMRLKPDNDPNNEIELSGKKEDDIATFPMDSANEFVSDNCTYGWISAMLTADGSCGHVIVNGNAIVDPLAWEHIAGATLGGAALSYFGASIMIPIGVKVCTSVVGCVAGVPLVVAGGAAVIEGGVLVWSGVQFTKKYLDDIFVVTP